MWVIRVAGDKAEVPVEDEAGRKAGRKENQRTRAETDQSFLGL